jgi:hypothetical protein
MPAENLRVETLGPGPVTLDNLFSVGFGNLDHGFGAFYLRRRVDPWDGATLGWAYTGPAPRWAKGGAFWCGDVSSTEAGKMLKSILATAKRRGIQIHVRHP